MNKVDVCLCEPFILPGILPTLGLATIKSKMQTVGMSCKMFYPSVKYFVGQELYKSPFLLSLVEDTPLQLVEFLFVDEARKEDAIKYICESMHTQQNTKKKEEIVAILLRLHEAAIQLAKSIAIEIANLHPKVLCISTTFGDLNFDLRLIENVKECDHNIKIICGGSNCDSGYSVRLMRMTDALDAVICDETGDITVAYIKNSMNDAAINRNIRRYVTDRSHIADETYRLKSLDDLPCPDFDDFFETTKSLGIKSDMITLPYELARGCWWGEEHPCSMCGFFGNQKKYIHKSSAKVISEIGMLVNKYRVTRIRFTDLVNPKMNLLKELLPLEKMNIRLFWELRPDLSEEQVELLRRIGLTCGQIGIESFSTNELCVIKKGTSGINNINVLRLLSEYKIEVIWNYLYGFTNDEIEWYETILNLMPSLFHLQPPSIRKIWINRFSELYDESDKEQLVPLGEDFFHDENNQGYDYFYKVIENEKMQGTYEALHNMIGKWRYAFNKHYSLLVIPMGNDAIRIERRYGEWNEDYRYEGNKCMMYLFLLKPRTLNECKRIFEDRCDVQAIVNEFLEEKTVVFLDNRYVAIACFPTRYRWTKYDLQPSYAGGRLFQEEKNGI